MSRFGYYSALAVGRAREGEFALKPGLWKTPTGEEVVVTYIGTTRNPAGSGYGWHDAKSLGELVELVREIPLDDDCLPVWPDTPSWAAWAKPQPPPK